MTIRKKDKFPNFISPQLATLVNAAPNSDLWLHEIKFDGYRILAFKKGHQVILKSRNNKDWTVQLLSISEAIKALPDENLILDGEVVVLDESGRSDFQLLQNAIKNQNNSATIIYFLFDVMYLNQNDLRILPLLERKNILKKIIKKKSPTLHYSDHVLKEGRQLYDFSCKHGLEGIVSKRIDGRYISRRSNEWLKIKCIQRQEFVICGYTSPQGKRSYFGSLYLGVFNKEGKLEYVGNVGTGFNQSTLKEMYQRLSKIKKITTPFSTRPPSSTHAHWVKPVLVAEIEFTEWTKQGSLRHPSFVGLRFDKNASQVVREVPTHLIV